MSTTKIVALDGRPPITLQRMVGMTALEMCALISVQCSSVKGDKHEPWFENPTKLYTPRGRLLSHDEVVDEYPILLIRGPSVTSFRTDTFPRTITSSISCCDGDTYGDLKRFLQHWTPYYTFPIKRMLSYDDDGIKMLVRDDRELVLHQTIGRLFLELDRTIVLQYYGDLVGTLEIIADCTFEEVSRQLGSNVIFQDDTGNPLTSKILYAVQHRKDLFKNNTLVVKTRFIPI